VAEGFIPLAVIGAPHGVRGEVRVKSFTADPVALAAYGPLRAENGRSFEIERLRPQKEVVVAKLRGVDDRDAAAKLTGLTLGIDRNALPDPDEDEYYLADLIGLSAVSAEGGPLGTITNVYNHGAGDILELTPPGGDRSALIPFTRASAPEVDIRAGRIVLVPPAEIDAKPEATEEEE
jgi:16S rRNA processing protein RimM